MTEQELQEIRERLDRDEYISKMIRVPNYIGEPVNPFRQYQEDIRKLLDEVERLQTEVNDTYADYKEKDLQLRLEKDANKKLRSLEHWKVVIDENERLLEVLREIDTHIRSTSNPVPHIISTLKKTLDEYR